MAQQTLFSILLRQPWWVTLLVAFALFALAHALFPPIAPFVALPFATLAFYIAYRHWRGSPPVDTHERLSALRGMSWEDFSALIANAYRRQGYSVSSERDAAFDLKLVKDGRITLVQCRRWKVSPVGAGPVRDLAAAVARTGASRGICIAAGDFSEPARKLSATEPVSLVSAGDLVDLVAPVYR